MQNTDGQLADYFTTDLPDDIGSCHALLAKTHQAKVESDKLKAEADKLNAELIAVCEELKKENKHAQWQIEALLQRLYGRKSERHVNQDQPLLPLFENAATDEAEEEHKPEPLGHEQPSTVRTKKPKRKGLHGRSELPANLERREHTVDVDECEKTCDCCGKERKIIGSVRSERLDYDPPKLFVEVEVRPKYALDCDCETDSPKIVVAEKPIRPIDRGMPGLGLLTYVVIGKYVHHLPHYRQADRVLTQNGVQLSRQVLWDWTRGTSELLQPLWELMQKQLSLSHIIGADETPVNMQYREDKIKRMKKAYFWVYRGDDRAPYTVFDFQPTRSQGAPDVFLKDFQKGYLQTDAYDGYNLVTSRDGITSVGCWAHARRKFKEAVLSSPHNAAQALVYIRELYDIEREIKVLEPVDRVPIRQEKSQEILKTFRKWLDSKQNGPDALPKSPLGKAINYSLNQWTELTRFLDDGEIRLDNNLVESSLRDIGVGRKNWLFVGSERGGRAAAILYTIIITARRHGLDIWQYLTDILPRLADLSPGELEHLLPDRWQAPGQ